MDFLSDFVGLLFLITACVYFVYAFVATRKCVRASEAKEKKQEEMYQRIIDVLDNAPEVQ